MLDKYEITGDSRLTIYDSYKESGELSFLVVQECSLYNKYLNEHIEEKAKVKVR